MAQTANATITKPIIDLKPVKKPDGIETTGTSLIKHFFYLLLSLVLTAGIFFFEGELALLKSTQMNEQIFVLTVEGNNRVELFRKNSDLPEQFLGKILLKEGDTIKTHASSNVTVKLPNDSVIRLDENTDLIVLEANESDKFFRFSLESGQAWVNNVHNSSHIILEADGFKMEPFQAIFNVERIENQLNVQVFRHQLNVSFYDENDAYLNDIYVAEGNQITVSLSKLQSLLSQLFYSKLIKEFRYGFYPKSLNDDVWIRQNLAKDAKQLVEVRDREMDKISNSGLKNGSINSIGFEAKSYFNERVKSLFTLLPDKKEDLFIDQLFAHIDDAIYLAEEGRVDEAVQRIEFFDMEKNTRFYLDAIGEEAYKKELEKRISQLVFVSVGEDLYVVREYLLRQRLKITGDDVSAYFSFLQYYLDDVYDAARVDYDKASVVLENYFDTVFKVLENTDAGVFGTHFQDVQVQNHFIDNLFLRYPTFYKKKFFNHKAKLEKLFLSSLPEGAEKDEERRSLISKKIDILKRLQFFFFEEESISLVDAKGAAGVLITSIQDILPSNTSKVAIKSLFEKAIDDFNLFWQFLNNEEYASSSLYGDTNKDRFEAYLKAQDESDTVTGVLEEFFSSSGSSSKSVSSKQQIIDQVSKDFQDILADNLRFSEDLEDGDRYVKIESASLGGYTFEGVYDPDKRVLAEVYIGGNLISQSGVKLKNLETLIKSKFESFKDSNLKKSADDEPKKELTKRQKLLILLFIKKLTSFSIDIQEDNIEIINEDTSSFRVSGVELLNAPEALYSFDVLHGESFATNIEIITLKHQIKVSEAIKLEDLTGDVQAAYNQYLEQIGVAKKDESEKTEMATSNVKKSPGVKRGPKVKAKP